MEADFPDPGPFPPTTVEAAPSSAWANQIPGVMSEGRVRPIHCARDLRQVTRSEPRFLHL